MKKLNFEKITLRLQTSSRGGGIEISLNKLGFKGHKMAAYQNYLGGGMLGRIVSNDTVRHANNVTQQLMYSDDASVEKLNEISEQLKAHFHEITNQDFDASTYEENQTRSVSSY